MPATPNTPTPYSFPPELDGNFYQVHKDLHILSDEALQAHFLHHGCAIIIQTRGSMSLW